MEAFAFRNDCVNTGRRLSRLYRTPLLRGRNVRRFSKGTADVYCGRGIYDSSAQRPFTLRYDLLLHLSYMCTHTHAHSTMSAPGDFLRKQNTALV